MVSEDNAIDFSAIVGKPVTVTLSLATAPTHYLNGIVGRFVQEETNLRLTRYFADIHPWLWLLTKTSDCQDLSEQDRAGDYREHLFRSRLHRFPQRSEKHLRQARILRPVQRNRFQFRVASDGRRRDLLFLRTQLRQTHARPGRRRRRTPNLSRTRIDAPSTSASRWWTTRRTYTITRCHGRRAGCQRSVCSRRLQFRDSQHGSQSRVAERYADVTRFTSIPADFSRRMPARSAPICVSMLWSNRRRSFAATVSCARLSRATSFELKDHYRADVNQTYVLESISHAATQESYTNSFTAFPADCPFRPQRVNAETEDRRHADCGRRR